MAKDPAEVFSVESILAEFSELSDPRSPINRKHLLGEVLVIAILAVVSGADGPQAIGIWAKCHEEWLRSRLELPGGIPSHDTIGRVLMAIEPSAFQGCFERWIASLLAQPVDSSEQLTDRSSEILAIDGKALRRSHHHRAGLGPLFW